MKNRVYILILILIIGSLNCYSKDFLITDYGAVSGKLSTQGIQKAVDECYACGGGTVLIPSGTFITGPVFLRSNTDIYLASGAVLKGSENIDDYKVNGIIHGIFYCEDEKNISISGQGIIDASGSHFYDPGKNHIADGFDMTEQNSHTHGNKSVWAENMSVTNCLLKSSSAGIRIGYGQHPIRRCVFSNIIIYDSHRGIGIFAHDSANIEDITFDNIIIETRLYNGHWWGHGEPIHLSCISRFAGHQAGQIKNISFNNINAAGEQGILIFGLKESRIENIQLNNIKLHIRKGKETLSYGGNFDLRPATPLSMQIFTHDIPGIYAQYINNLSVDGFELSWDKQLPEFFTDAIEIENFQDVTISNMSGSHSPDSKDKYDIRLSDGYGFRLFNSESNGNDPIVERNNVKNK